MLLRLLVAVRLWLAVGHGDVAGDSIRLLMAPASLVRLAVNAVPDAMGSVGKQRNARSL